MGGKATCRCCLTWSPDKDLKARHKWLGETEIYADMLEQCFDIKIKAGSSSKDSGICYSCILRLRDAFNFKKQILKCQRKFEEQLQKKNVLKEGKLPRVKEEIVNTDDDEFHAGDLLQDNFSEVHLKEEIGDTKDDKNTLQPKCYAEPGITVRKAPQLPQVSRLRKPNLKLTVTAEQTSANSRGGQNELAKHMHNIQTIIKNSNATPFLNKTFNGFVCSYCKMTISDLENLKAHNETHSGDKLRLVGHKTGLNAIAVKLDITDLKCNVCCDSFEAVSDLKKHLIKEHKFVFHMDIKDYILEFKLSEAGKYDCALCSSQFETFKMLLQHMNGHYRNYVCDKCGSGYINLVKLQSHKKTHMTGEYKCSKCAKTFSSNVKRNYHEKHVHNAPPSKTKCPICDEKFLNYYQRNHHMFKEHDTVAADYRCKVCDMKFLIKHHLTKHIRKIHLLEKNHICEQCGKEFHSKERLKEHMIKHFGERTHRCAICAKAYARKKTLREHMRIHLNDRRFKCGLCDLAFVQKCSLKSHMISNHGLKLSEYESSEQFELEHCISSISE